MEFYRFDDKKLDDLENIINLLKYNNIGQNFKIIIDYCSSKIKSTLSIFDFINDLNYNYTDLKNCK